MNESGLQRVPKDEGDHPDTVARLVADNTGLIATSLGKSFRKRPVLRDVNVAVQRGEAVGLLGPNGAGKTSCFYIITGLLAPDVGTISLDGHDITELPMYRRARLGIGYLPQEASIFRGLSVEHNIRAILEVIEPVYEVREAALDALLAEFSITHHNVRETLDIVDRAYILHEGRVLMEGRPSEIVADVDVRRVYLGERFSL